MNRRAQKAYFLTFSVLIKYIKLYAISKLLGQKYWDRRISKLHQKSALKIKKTLLELNGLYIKVGQLISILSNVLPEEFRKPMAELQDKNTARPYEEIEKSIVEEFNKPVKQLFKEFNAKPLASASIGQTHRATLFNDQQVVVKVQYNNIKEIAKTDLEVIKNQIKIISYFFSIKGINYMYSQIKLMIEEELDYIHEAQAMESIALNLKGIKGVQVPQLIKEYSGKKVITSSYCEGVKISNLKQLDSWGIDKSQLADKFLNMYCKMIFEDDIFHADPHPGNILVNQQGDIVLLDFGAVTKLSPNMKTGLPEFMIAFSRNNTDGIVAALKKMGFIGSGLEAQKLAERLIIIGQDFLQNEIKIDSFNIEGISIDENSHIISKLLKAINFKEISNTFQIPKDWILLQRVMLLVLGTYNELAPKSNPIDVIKPYIKKHAMSNMGSIIIDNVKSQIGTLLALPTELKKTLQKANRDGIEINFENVIKSNKTISNVLQQMVFIILTIAALYFSKEYNHTGQLEYAYYLKWASGLFFLFFVRYFFKKN